MRLAAEKTKQQKQEKKAEQERRLKKIEENKLLAAKVAKNEAKRKEFEAAER